MTGGSIVVFFMLLAVQTFQENGLISQVMRCHLTLWRHCDIELNLFMANYIAIIGYSIGACVQNVDLYHNWCCYCYCYCYYTPRTTKLLGGILVSLRPSVRPSVRLSRLPCPLCNIYSSGWILSILATNDHYHERVCRTQWPLTLTYIFKVIRPWLRKSCPLCSVYSSGWILFILGKNDYYH